MKKRLPKTWTKKFAWLPVITTIGLNDIGSLIWLTTYYYKFVGPDAYGEGQVQILSKEDREYNEQMLFEIELNPDRFGTDPYRST